MTEPWTSRDDARLRTGWATGVSAATIGASMGRTKNSVIGRVHRLGLPARPSPIKPRPEGQPKAKRVHRRKTAPVVQSIVRNLAIVPRVTNGTIVATLPTLPVVVPVAPPVIARPRSLRACCYPMWPNGPVPNPAPYCAAPTAGRIYCPEHHALCYTARQLSDAAQNGLAKVAA